MIPIGMKLIFPGSYDIVIYDIGKGKRLKLS